MNNDKVVLTHGDYHMSVFPSQQIHGLDNQALDVYCVINTVTNVREWEGFYFGQAVKIIKKLQEDWAERDRTLSSLALAPNVQH